MTFFKGTLIFLAGMFFGIVVSCILLAKKNLERKDMVEEKIGNKINSAKAAGKRRYNEVMGIPNEWEDGKPRFSVHAFDEKDGTYEELRDGAEQTDAEIVALKAADDIMNGTLMHDGIPYTHIHIYRDKTETPRHEEYSELYEVATPTPDGAALKIVAEESGE